VTRSRQQPRGAAVVVVGGVAVVAQQDVRRDIGFAGQRLRDVGTFEAEPDRSRDSAVYAIPQRRSPDARKPRSARRD
jgi:hypothetical protein